jgi:hypothetical protein
MNLKLSILTALTLMTTLAEAQTTRWTGSFYSYSSMAKSANAYNYVGLNYLLSDTTQISARPSFMLDAQSTMADFHLVYTDAALIATPALMAAAYVKLYLPTSEDSQKSGMVFGIKPETAYNYLFSARAGVTYFSKPQVNLATAANQKKDRVVVSHDHYAEFAFKLAQDLTLKPALGFVETWSEAGIHETKAKTILGMEMRLLKNLSCTFGAQNLAPLDGRRGPVQFFHPDDNSLFLLTTASL